MVGFERMIRDIITFLWFGHGGLGFLFALTRTHYLFPLARILEDEDCVGNMFYRGEEQGDKSF